MVTAGDFKKGVTFEMDGSVYVVVEFQHVKPGKGAAFVRTKIRNVMTGAVTETTFSPNEKFPLAHIDRDGARPVGRGRVRAHRICLIRARRIPAAYCGRCRAGRCRGWQRRVRRTSNAGRSWRAAAIPARASGASAPRQSAIAPPPRSRS